MQGPETEPQLPPGLRLLKTLVTVLMVTMIVGVITVVWLLVTRMPNGNAPVALPASLALPAGVRPLSITQGPGWIGVVTEDSRFLIFRLDGSLRDELAIKP